MSKAEWSTQPAVTHRSIYTKGLPTASSVRLADISSYLLIYISIAH